MSFTLEELERAITLDSAVPAYIAPVRTAYGVKTLQGTMRGGSRGRYELPIGADYGHGGMAAYSYRV
jgi:hypothetical protein